MRNRAGVMFGVAMMLVLGVAVGARAQGAGAAQMGGGKGQNAGPKSPWKFYPQDRAEGDGGPAPKRDLTGSWAGPGSGMAVPRGAEAEKPSLTPLGEKMMADRKSLQKFSPAGTNDPHVRYCDPFGMPQNAIAEIRSVMFATAPDRVLLLLQYQDLWRQIWTDGRKLPDMNAKGAPDVTYNGYSVGNWEDDYNFVVKTTGINDVTWVTPAGYPHTPSAVVTERYTRVDKNDIKLTISIEDPKIYTKPFNLGTYNFRWIPNQMIAEWQCVPSEVEEYLQEMGDPAGSDPNAPPQRR